MKTIIQAKVLISFCIIFFMVLNATPAKAGFLDKKFMKGYALRMKLRANREVQSLTLDFSRLKRQYKQSPSASIQSQIDSLKARIKEAQKDVAFWEEIYLKYNSNATSSVSDKHNFSSDENNSTYSSINAAIRRTEVKPPKTTCSFCGGSGVSYYLNGFRYDCCFCLGKGIVTDPQWVMNRARKNGAAEAQITIAQVDIMGGNNFTAFETLRTLFVKDDHDRHGQAAYWLGICFEMGIGTTESQGMALKLYKYAKERNCTEGTEAFYRVTRKGFYPATDAQRKSFAERLKVENEIKGAAAKAWLDANKSSNSSSGGSSFDGCAVCGGSGRCSGCAGRGQYQVSNSFYNTSHYVDCKECHGGGKCTSCHGTGRL